MAKKTVADAAKAKAEKQKKMAIGLSILLVLAMAYAVHTMLSLNKGGASSGKPEAAPLVGTTATPSSTPSSPPSAPTIGGAATTSGSTASSGATGSQNGSPLISAVTPPTGAGQLQSFSLFESKDPFHSSGPSSGSAGGGGSKSGGGGGSSSGGGSSGGTPKTPPAPPTAPPGSAVISVNGVAESVTSSSAFPAANPMFQLVSLTNTTAKVSILGGSYADGAATLTLKTGKAVTLVNTADGTRYTLLLMPQGTTAAAGSSGSTGSTTPTTTLPTSGG